MGAIIILGSQKRNIERRSDKMSGRTYDYRKLRGRIKEKLGTEGEFARRINRTQNYVSKVFRNGTYLSQEDIASSAEVLDIPQSDIGVYFFEQKVHENETDI